MIHFPTRRRRRLAACSVVCAVMAVPTAGFTAAGLVADIGRNGELDSMALHAPMLGALALELGTAALLWARAVRPVRSGRRPTEPTEPTVARRVTSLIEPSTTITNSEYVRPYVPPVWERTPPPIEPPAVVRGRASVVYGPSVPRTDVLTESEVGS